MKTYYTSNYERDGGNPAAIAISNPDDVPVTYVGKRDESLSPTSDLNHAYQNEHIDHDEYAKRYRALLTERGLSPASIADKYEDGTVFICFDYEDGDASVCHRVILGEWLEEAKVAHVIARQDVALDHGVEETFPASDPVSAHHIT